MFISNNNEKLRYGVFSLYHKGFFSGAGGTNLKFTSSNSNITPAIILDTGAPTPIWKVTESTGAVFTYTTESFSHTKTAGTGNMSVQLANTDALSSYVLNINFNGDGIISSFWNLNIHKFTNLTALYLYNNSIIGNLANWKIQSSLVTIHLQINNLTGDLSNLVLPSTVTDFRIRTNGFSGILSTWTLSSNLLYLYLYENNFTAGPRISVGSSPLIQYRIDSNLLNQAAVDQICLDAYNNRANFTAAAPLFNVDGTGNSTPSGIYQDGDPPTTGKEYIYELVNDPESEGFNKQNWTYN